MHVLFLYASTGSGHFKAAEYVRQALIRENPDICCSMVDVLNLCTIPVESFILKGFRLIISRFPRMYRLLYQLTENNALFNIAAGLLFSESIKQLIKMCRDLKVSTIVCTHPFALLFASRLKKKLGESSPVTMGIITDYRIHRFWLYKPIDMYFVPNEEMKCELLNLGWENDKVYITGIPCPVNINTNTLSDDLKKPFLVVAGGGWGLGNLEGTVIRLLNANLEFCLVVVTGKNTFLYRKLKNLELQNPGRMIVVSTLPDLYALIKKSGGIITKPGGLTVTEAMILKKPLILSDPLPGAEEHNYRFLTEHRAAITLHTFLKNPDIILNWDKTYSKRQASLAHTDSSLMIAERILAQKG